MFLSRDASLIFQSKSVADIFSCSTKISDPYHFILKSLNFREFHKNTFREYFILANSCKICAVSYEFM